MSRLKYLTTYIFNFLYISGSFFYNPFENWRKVANHKNPFIAAPIWVLIIIYFTLSGFIYRKSSLVAFLIFAFFIIVFILISFAFRKKLYFRELFNVWSFSYLPTILWFWITFFLFFILPPPRNHDFFGFIFSLIYLFFSLFCLYLKIICLFVVFKYVVKLSLIKTIIFMLAVWGIVALMGINLYRLHFFRIPFI